MKISTVWDKMQRRKLSKKVLINFGGEEEGEEEGEGVFKQLPL